MGGTAGSGSRLPEQFGCRIRQFAQTAHAKYFPKVDSHDNDSNIS